MGEMKERMLRGELYIADDPELTADYERSQELLVRSTPPERRTRRSVPVCCAACSVTSARTW
jgi:hypothetical protein